MHHSDDWTLLGWSGRKSDKRKQLRFEAAEIAGRAMKTKRATHLVRLMLAMGLCLSAMIYSGKLRSEDLIGRYYVGLRQRSLYVVAEEYAVNQLARISLLPRQRAELTSELAQTLIEHGSVSNAAEREALWAEAERILGEYLQNNAHDLVALRVVCEQALLPYRYGETLAWESQFAPGNSSLRQAAKDKFTQARSTISDAIEKLSQSGTPSPQEFADGALDRSELKLMEFQLGYLRIKTAVLLADLEEDFAHKTRLLSEADADIRALLRSKIDAPISVEAKLLRAVIARHREQFEQSEAVLRSLEIEANEYGLTDRILAEQVRLAIDQQRVDVALEIVNTRIQSGPLIADELRAVAVDALLAAWQLAGLRREPELQKELLVQAKHFDSQTHGKWQQFTHARLNNILQESDLGTDLAQLIRDAQIKYQSGEFLEAIDGFRGAAALAEQSGRTDRAIDFAFTVGSIQIQLEDWQAAAKTFGEILSTHKTHQRAADAGLMKCYALGRIYHAEPSQAAREQYEESLRTHEESFSKTESASEAAWMLAIHLEQRLQWTDAIGEYRRIPADDLRFDTASLRILLLYEKILNRLRQLNGDVSIWESQLLEEISRINDQFPQTRLFQSLDQTRTGLKVAQLLLQHSRRWYDVADIWLARIKDTVEAQKQEAVRREEPIPAEWQQIDRGASQLRIVSLAGQQRLAEAQELMFRLGETSPEAMLGILLGLTELTSRVDPDRQVDLGRLQLEAVRRLATARGELSPENQFLLDGAHAEALIAIGNLHEAATMYEELVAKFPKDQKLIEKLIEVLMLSGRRQDLERARTCWTAYERLQKTGSPKWISARLEIAKLSKDLGDYDGARKLLGVTRTLYPQLGTPELKADVTALLEELPTP